MQLKSSNNFNSCKHVRVFAGVKMWQSRKYGNWQLAIDYKLLRGSLSALLNCCKNLPLGYYLAECKFCKFYILRLWNYVFYQPQNLTLSGRIIFFKSLKKVLSARVRIQKLTSDKYCEYFSLPDSIKHSNAF